MTAILKFDQAGLPGGTNNRSREDIVAGTLVTITDVSPGAVDTLDLLWKPPEDDTAVIAGASPTWTITPKMGTWGTYRFRLTVDGVVSEHTFDVKSPVLGLPELAPNEKADPTASLIKNTSTEIDASETNEAFGVFSSGSAWGWWYKIRRWLRKVDDLFHGTTGHNHDGSDGNGPAISNGSLDPMTLAELNALITDATLVDKDSPNTWTRKQTITPSVSEEALEATGGTSQTAIKAHGGVGSGAGEGGTGIETDGGIGGATGQGGAGIISSGGNAGGGNAEGGSASEFAGGIGAGNGAGGFAVQGEGGDGGVTGSGSGAAFFQGGGAGGSGDGDGGDGIYTAGGSGEGSGQDGLALSASDDVKIKMYSQAAEPTLLEDEAAAFWKDTDDSDKIYLIFRRGTADQVKIQLT